jgi:hypothetical protein
MEGDHGHHRRPDADDIEAGEIGAAEAERRRLNGKIDRIGLSGTNLIVNDPAGKPPRPRRRSSCLPARWRSRRNTARSTSMAKPRVRARSPGPGDDGQAQHDREDIGQIAAHHGELDMGEIGEAQDRIGQRDATAMIAISLA